MGTVSRIPAVLPGQLDFFSSKGLQVIEPEERFTLRSPQVLRWFSREEAYPREWKGKLVRTAHTFRSGDKVMRAYLLGKPRQWIDVQWIPDPPPKPPEEALADGIAS